MIRAQARSALRWAGAVLGLAVFVLLLQRLAPQADALADAWRRLDAWHVLAAFLGFFASQFFFARSWHGLLHSEGERGEFAGDAARWCVSLAGKYFPGKVWQAVARFGLYHGAARGARVAPAYLRETLLGLSAAMGCVAMGVPSAWIGQPPGMLFPLCLLGAVLLIVLASPRPVAWIAARVERWAPGHAQVPATGWRALVGAWGGQLIGYLLLGLGFFALGHGLGFLGWQQWNVAIAALVFGGLAGIAAFFVPAGIGVREAAIAWFLAPVVGGAPALMLAVLARAWISVGELVLIVGGLAWLQRHPRAQEDG